MRQDGSVAKVDLTDVLDDADLATGFLNPALSVDGDTLTWAIPETPPGSPTTVGFRVVVRSTVTRATLAAVAAPATAGGSCETCSVSVGIGAAPISRSSAPTTTGTARVGAELTSSLDTSGWPAGTTFTSFWLADGVRIPGATGATYTPSAAQLGARITAAVTGHLDGYADTTRAASPTAAVLARELTATSTPTITGRVRVGATLTADPGTWESGATMSYRWLRDGTPLAGATSRSYQLRAQDRGHRLAVVATGTKPGAATASRTSDPTTPVALGVQARHPRPQVRGTAKVGRPLRAVAGRHDAGTRVRLRWYAGGRAIAGATATTYRIRSGQVGKRLTVRTTVTKPGYTTVVRTSRPSPVARRS